MRLLKKIREKIDIKKISANLILVLFLVAISFGFFFNFHQRRSQFDKDTQLLNKDENELRVIYDPFYEVFDFVIDHVDEGSKVLFIESAYFWFGQPYLYPKIESRFFYYVNDTNDQEMFDYLKANSIDNILVTREQDSYFWNTTCFAIVDYFNENIFLLKVEKEEL